MFKLLIACLLILITIKAQAFEQADTGSYESQFTTIETRILMCKEEVEIQHYNLVSDKDYIEMIKECETDTM